MQVSFIPILVALLSSGAAGNHLLDYASTDVYWKSKGVNVSADALAAELRPVKAQDIGKLLVDLASPQAPVRAAAARQIREMGPAVLPQLEAASKIDEPELVAAVKALMSEIHSASKAQSVRKLMAIRTLGELGKPEALATLQPLTESQEPFVAEYARRAIAQINKQDYVPRAATAEQRRADLAILPASSRAVISAAMLTRTGPVRSFDQFVDEIQIPAGGFFGPVDGDGAPKPPDKAQVKAEITKMVIELAEKIGDVRVDGITAALAGEVGPDAGFAVVIVRGEYDPVALQAVLRKEAGDDLEVKPVGGFDVYHPDDNAGFFFPSSDRFIFFGGASYEQLPIAELAANCKAGKGKLPDEPEMADLLKGLDLAQQATGVIRVTASYKQAPVLNAFDVIKLSARRNGDVIDGSIEGTGNDPDAVKAASDFINAGVQQALGQAAEAEKMMPPLKPIFDTLRTLKCTADKTKATLTAQMKQDPTVMLMGFFFTMRMGAAAPPPPPPAADPAPVPPQQQ